MLLICRIEENTEKSVVKKLYSLSSDERRKKADMISDNRKKAISLSAGLLQRLLKEKYNFKYTSISHSGKLSACLGSNVPCGLDIEKISHKKRKLVERVCTKEELSAIDKSSSPDIEFIKFWTVKEASFKAGTGESLTDFFSQNKEIEEKKKEYTFETEIFEDYVITVCEKILK